MGRGSDVPFIMRSFNEALGVQCTYCHLEGDYAAEGNPKKDMARKMISMGRVIDTNFPSGNGVYTVSGCTGSVTGRSSTRS